MKTVDLNITGLQIAILEDPISDPDQLDIRGLNIGYVILLIGGKVFVFLLVKIKVVFYFWCARKLQLTGLTSPWDMSV